MSNELIPINCPFTRKDPATGVIFPCPQLCVKVAPGSRGEAWCRRCRLSFDFEVDAQSTYKPSVRVQNVKNTK